MGLSKNHGYYFQIQGQLAITGREYCDFFVYTSRGEYIERIRFDDTLWLQLLERLKRFWINHLPCKILLEVEEDPLSQAASELNLSDNPNTGKNSNTQPIQSNIPNKKSKLSL